MSVVHPSSLLDFMCGISSDFVCKRVPTSLIFLLGRRGLSCWLTLVFFSISAVCMLLWIPLSVSIIFGFVRVVFSVSILFRDGHVMSSVSVLCSFGRVCCSVSNLFCCVRVHFFNCILFPFLDASTRSDLKIEQEGHDCDDPVSLI